MGGHSLPQDIELCRSRGYARGTLKSATEATPLLKRVARDIASEFDKDAAGRPQCDGGFSP
ncbi:hypothetical protein A5641_09665 [Mycobacterium sp. 1554424.7]|nr:hypothetical protein A5641_09665 [Mycobacterium sp. 1554424.7]